MTGKEYQLFRDFINELLSNASNLKKEAETELDEKRKNSFQERSIAHRSIAKSLDNLLRSLNA